MFPDVVPHLLLSPRNERINLNELVHGIPFYYLHILARHTLLTTQAAYPRIQTFKGPLQRFQFSDLAAAMPAFYRVIEKVDTLLTHHTLYLVVVREKHFQLDAIRQVRLVDKLISLREESPCIESEDTRPTLPDNDICQRLVFDAER